MASRLRGNDNRMIKKYSVTIVGHATSFTLEPEFWAEINALATAQNRPLAQVIADIDQNRGDNNLSSAIRVYVLNASKGERL